MLSWKVKAYNFLDYIERRSSLSYFVYITWPFWLCFALLLIYPMTFLDQLHSLLFKILKSPFEKAWNDYDIAEVKRQIDSGELNQWVIEDGKLVCKGVVLQDSEE